MQALTAIVAAGTAMAALGTMTFGFMAGDTTDTTEEGEARA
ncbi:hypothetical protein VMT65_35255 [Nocardia sp. CDC153]|nr:hypothetical protein [Nocardia sp. CDC153]MEC3958336.1 hypothetical protein [Nocardia sp. CDC153]